MKGLSGLALVVGLAACHSPPVATAPPPGATDEEVVAGRSLYHGLGGCSGCHGDAGRGTPVGPELVAGEWLLGDGSLPWLVHMTRHGGLGARARDDDPRPMRGPTMLDSAQVRLVAVYVWSISRARRPAGTATQ